MARVKRIIVISVFCNILSLHAHWNPQTYKESNEGQFKHAIKEFPKLALTGTESILDIGCGDGRLSDYIARTYIPQGKLLGIDNNQAMVAMAQASKQSSNIDFELGDIATYHSSQTYDVIVSFWTLHWVADYDEALKNIALLLKPGGKTLLCHIVEEYPSDRWIEKLLNHPKWRYLKSAYVKTLCQPSLEKVIDAIRKSSLIIEHLEVKQNSETSPYDTVRKNLLSTPLLAFVPDSERDAFCDDLLHCLALEYQTETPGVLRKKLTVIALVLRKP